MVILGEKLIDDEAIYGAFEEDVNEILKGIKKVFESTPPELAADIFEKGIYLTGGGSLLYDMDRAIANEIGFEVHRVEEPLKAVIVSIQKMISMYNKRDEV